MNSDIFKLRSLKTKLTLFTLVLFITGLWSMAYYLSHMLREDMERQLGQQQFSTATLMAATVNREMYYRLDSLQKTAKEINPRLLGNSRSLQAYLGHQPILQDLFNGGVTVLNLQGYVIADAPHMVDRVGSSCLDRDYVISALKDGNATVGRPVIAKKLKVPIFSMAVPIRDAHGKIIGALLGATDLSKQNFLDNIHGNHYGKTGGYIIAVRKYRLIVSATEKSRVMEIYPGPGAIPLIDRFAQGYEGSGIAVNPHGVEVLVSAKSIPVSDWVLAVSLPTDEAFAPIRKLQERMLLVTLVVTLLACALTWWMLKRLLLPMSSAVKTLSAHLLSNSFPQTLAITSRDEIGELIRAFNNLLSELTQKQIALKKSEERCRNLIEWTPEAILVHKEGRIIYANPAGGTLFGDAARTALEGTSVLDLVHPDYRPIVQERMKKMAGDGLDASKLEEKLVRLDGAEFDAEVQSTWIMYDDEPALHTILRDITERKKAEESLESTRLLLDETEHIGHIGGWKYLIGDEKLIWTRETYNIHEVDMDFELSLEKAVSFYAPASKLAIQNLMNRAIEYAEPFEIEAEIITARGNLRSVHTVGKVDIDRKQIYGFCQDITVRSLIEKKLIAREREFRTLAENAPDNIARFDQNARFVYINPQLEITMGVPAAELLGKAPNEVSSDGRNSELDMNVRRVIATSQSAEFCMTLPDAGKGERFHHLRLTPETDENGKVSGVLVIGRDITESRRAWEALQNEIEKNRSLFRYASDGIHILDAEGCIIEVSDSFCFMLGYKRDEMIGMNVFQWDDEIPLNERLIVIQKNIAKKSRNVFETRHRRKDGTVFDVEISTYPFELDGRSVLYCSTRDISERKENELIKSQLSEQLRQYADTISDLYDKAPCGYHSLDQEGKFVHINETELNLLGFTRYELVGKRSIFDLLTPDTALIYREAFILLQKEGAEHDLELSLIRKNGTILPVMISSSAVYDEDGNFTMSRSTVYDMTERKKVEEERMSNLNRLKHLSLHLVAAQEEARRQLSSELHDRTSPNLAAISINLDIISDKLPRHRSKDLSARLEDTRALILDTAASIREIGADLRPPLLDYAGLAAALESHLQLFMKRTGISVEFECEYPDERFRPDLESMLFRIVQEALTNCAKHAHAKYIKVSLTHVFQRIVLTVCDDGVGFIPSRLGQGGNIGLGILNMREMAELAGGRLTIDSEIDLGTSITVEVCLTQYS